MELLSIRKFQSTRPSRASTRTLGVRLCMDLISIHKALAGLDGQSGDNYAYITDFNPQGPRGPRLVVPLILMRFLQFQSTRPSRASTALFSLLSPSATIFQSTRPSRASTQCCRCWKISLQIFQSTRPSRASTRERTQSTCQNEISIHKALAGLDLSFAAVRFMQVISIHKALAGLDIPLAYIILSFC